MRETKIGSLNSFYRKSLATVPRCGCVSAREGGERGGGQGGAGEGARDMCFILLYVLYICIYANIYVLILIYMHFEDDMLTFRFTFYDFCRLLKFSRCSASIDAALVTLK
jgi:hypothetical protein